MIKLLHCADLHLDSPFSYDDPEKAEVRRNELRGTFTSLMMYIEMNKIDIALIAGDLFDVRFITKDTVNLVTKEFAKNSHCKFVISPGNHDPYEENSVYSRIDFPDNVYIFKEQSLSRISFDDLAVDVYGYAFHGSTLHSPLNGFQLSPSPNRLQLLCAHADVLSPLSNQGYVPLSSFEKMGFDYAALGHIHNTDGMMQTSAGGYYGYCGCLAGRDYGECGYKGAFVAELSKENGMLTGNVFPQRFSRRRYEWRTLDITGAEDAGQVLSMVRAMINESKYGEDTSLRIDLVGDVPPEMNISRRMIEESAGKLFHLELRDRTSPLFDYQKLLADPTIKGAFFAELLPMLRDGSEEEREQAAMALRYGLAAIRGSELGTDKGGRTL